METNFPPKFYFFITIKTVSENLNFDEQILEAAKSITNAAGVLIKAATSAQQELIAQGKVTICFLLLFKRST
jgi:hypothetical protein